MHKTRRVDQSQSLRHGALIIAISNTKHRILIDSTRNGCRRVAWIIRYRFCIFPNSGCLRRRLSRFAGLFAQLQRPWSRSLSPVRVDVYAPHLRNLINSCCCQTTWLEIRHLKMHSLQRRRKKKDCTYTFFFSEIKSIAVAYKLKPSTNGRPTRDPHLSRAVYLELTTFCFLYLISSSGMHNRSS